MNMNTSEMNGSILVTLEGDLGIEQAGEIKDLFLSLFRGNKPLTLGLDRVESAHVAVLQILCSAHRSFRNSEMSLTLKGPLPPRFRVIIEEAGFGRERGCPLDSNQTCLFATGGDNG